MKVRHCSDLHLEFNDPPLKRFNPKKDEILLVAGDTIPAALLRSNRTDKSGRKSRYRFDKFLYHVAGYYNVIFVTGNHEHYQGNITDSLELFVNYIHKLGFSQSMHVLEDGFMALNENTFLLGCNLWTNFNKNNPLAHQIAGMYMNDYEMIANGEDTGREVTNRRSEKWGGKFTTQDAYDLHTRSLSHLSQMYDYHTKDFEKGTPNGKTKIIVLTHTAPSSKSAHAKNLSTIDYSYFSDLSDFILDRPQITNWIHGHTHHPVNYKIGECTVASNPLGYGISNAKDACFDGFSTDTFFEI